MPHLHTQPHGHDMTISAWIMRRQDGEVKALVHRHRKLHIWLQPGGHIEHTENPWQALAHELREETGYELSQLRVLQALPVVEGCIHDVMHPAPVAVNTHSPYPGHFHSDLVMAMITDEDPAGEPGPGESRELAWMSPDEFAALAVVRGAGHRIHPGRRTRTTHRDGAESRVGGAAPGVPGRQPPAPAYRRVRPRLWCRTICRLGG
ncbi:MAG: hypothetical protein DI600_08505 [Cutibacterium granulosum]|nr:MAG: hypothetical protein DI600_08505 [Cutibacterium granulosum]